MFILSAKLFFFLVDWELIEVIYRMKVIKDVQF